MRTTTSEGAGPGSPLGAEEWHPLLQQDGAGAASELGGQGRVLGGRGEQAQQSRQAAEAPEIGSPLALESDSQQRERGRIGSIAFYDELEQVLERPTSTGNQTEEEGEEEEGAEAEVDVEDEDEDDEDEAEKRRKLLLYARETIDQDRVRMRPGSALSTDSALSADAASASSDAVFVHTVTPADTLGGLELRYGVCAMAIRRLNGMSSDRLTSHIHVQIPKAAHLDAAPEVPSDEGLQRLQVLRQFRLLCPGLSLPEVEVYLADANGDARLAMRKCQQDLDWERANWERYEESKSPKYRPSSFWHRRFSGAHLKALSPWRRNTTAPASSHLHQD